MAGGDTPSAGSRPVSFLTAAFWTLLVAVLLAVGMTMLESVHPGAFNDVVTGTTCKLLAYSVVLFGMLRVHAPEAPIRNVLALRRGPPILLALAGVVGAGLSPAAMWLDGVLARRYPATPAEVEALQRLFEAPTPGKKIALVLSFAVVMPICDELFFRGALFTTVKSGRRAEAVIVATAVYDTLLSGAQPREIASMLGIALAISWMRAVTGSVLPSMTARMAFFGVQVVPLVLAEELQPTAVHAVAGAVVAAASLVGMAAIGKRSSRVREARSKDG